MNKIFQDKTSPFYKLSARDIYGVELTNSFDMTLFKLVYRVTATINDEDHHVVFADCLHAIDFMKSLLGKIEKYHKAFNKRLVDYALKSNKRGR